MSDELSRRRAAIDALDEKIVGLLNERAQLASEIGRLKGSGAIYHPQREAQVLERVRSAGKGPLAVEALKRIYVEIMSACRALEKPLSIAYLGPEGTFSEMAVLNHFGASVGGAPCHSIDEVFAKTEAGAADYGVVPVENSSEGAIGRTMDLLVSSRLKICGEVVLAVRQNLMARNAMALEGVSRVYSHEQSFGQCANWLAQSLPRADRIAVSSNAEAARRASQEPGTCAIGPELAAQRYGLTLLAQSIQDDPRNMTRFLVLGAQSVGRSGRDRTSMAMSAPNRPGAVLDLITPFARNGVSMTRIESRPARTGQWEYLFFIDIEGHEADGAVAKSLEEVKQKAPFFKIFGSYPASR